MIVSSLFVAALALSPAPEQAAASPGYLMWDVTELEERNDALGTRIGPDGSARETLADYETPAGSHRFRFIRRDSDGRPEQHDEIDDVVLIQSGAGTILVGGEMLGRTGDLGTSIDGGRRYEVGAGDVLRIPAGTPHAYLPADGSHITYVLVRLPAFRGEVVTDPDGQAPELDPEGFALWRASELERRSQRLGERIGSDDSGRETLADYGPGGLSHRFRYIRRDGDGWPEWHGDIIDVVFVKSGAGTMHVGGEMVGQSNAPGSSINGGERYSVAAGDVLHIPARTPHAYLVPDGDGRHITYVLVRFPAVD